MKKQKTLDVKKVDLNKITKDTWANPLPKYNKCEQRGTNCKACADERCTIRAEKAD
mgnify:CR=1 FL=1